MLEGAFSCGQFPARSVPHFQRVRGVEISGYSPGPESSACSDIPPLEIPNKKEARNYRMP